MYLMDDSALFKLGKPALLLSAMDASHFTNLYLRLTAGHRSTVIRMIRGKKCQTVPEHAFFGTRLMVWTAPFCALGIARFLVLLFSTRRADGPTEAMLRDPPFMLNLALWAAAVLTIIYFC